jgi:hyperosmotically inducible periplasmic protein
MTRCFNHEEQEQMRNARLTERYSDALKGIDNAAIDPVMETPKLGNEISATRRRVITIATLTLFVAFGLLGCDQHKERADVKDAVNSALTSNNLGVVSVSQDREKGVLTLSGDVESADKKQLAETVVHQVAPDYAISNQIGVRPPGAESQAKAVDSSLDSGIEDNYKAAIKAHKNMDDQSISYSSKNGTLVLKGSVRTSAQKNEASKLAKSIPNVKEVVNEIEVKSDKQSTSR